MEFQVVKLSQVKIQDRARRGSANLLLMALKNLKKDDCLLFKANTEESKTMRQRVASRLGHLLKTNRIEDNEFWIEYADTGIVVIRNKDFKAKAKPDKAA
jgi:hypothetical protein